MMEALLKLYWLPLDAKDELLKKSYKLADDCVTAGIMFNIIWFYLCICLSELFR